MKYYARAWIRRNKRAPRAFDHPDDPIQVNEGEPWGTPEEAAGPGVVWGDSYAIANRGSQGPDYN